MREVANTKHFWELFYFEVWSFRKFLVKIQSNHVHKTSITLLQTNDQGSRRLSNLPSVCCYKMIWRVWRHFSPLHSPYSVQRSSSLALQVPSFLKTAGGKSRCSDAKTRLLAASQFTHSELVLLCYMWVKEKKNDQGFKVKVHSGYLGSEV